MPKNKIKEPTTNTDTAEIPEYVYESLAHCLLPVIQKYYESEEGKKVFAEWKSKRDVEKNIST